MIRTIGVVLASTILTAVYASRVVIGGWRGRPDMPCVCERLAREWARLVLRLAGVRVEVSGAEGMDWNEPSVMVANHQSWFDVFALTGYMPGRIRFVAKEELGRIPIFGRAWKVCGHISIDRSDRRGAIESLDRAAERVKQEGLAILIFPEGTRSSDGRLREFKKGAFVLAIKTGVPVVPVGISGTRDVMPKGSWSVRPGKVHIRIGRAIPVDDLRHADRERLRERSRTAVAALLDGSDSAGMRPPGVRSADRGGSAHPAESPGSADPTAYDVDAEDSTDNEAKETTE